MSIYSDYGPKKGEANSYKKLRTAVVLAVGSSD